MKTRTEANLVADVRFYSGLGTSQAVTDAQIMRLLNESVVEAAIALSGAKEEKYLSKSASVTVNAGTTAVTFPNDCFRPERLSWVDSGGQETPIKRAALDDAQYINTTQEDWSTTEPFWVFDGTQMHIYPVTSSNRTVKLYYQSYMMGIYNTGGTAITEFSATTDYLDCRLALDSWVVYNASMKAKIAQELDYKDLAYLRMDVESRIGKIYSSRATASPKRLPRSKYYDSSGGRI